MPNEAVIIPVEFDSTRAETSLAKVDQPLRGISTEGAKLSDVFKTVGSRIGEAFKIFAAGGLIAGGALIIKSLAKDFFSVETSINGADEALKRINKTMEEANSSTAGQIAKVNALVKAATNAGNNYKIQARAIEQLKKISKEYFGDLDAGKSSFEKITTAAQNYTKAIIQQAVVEGLKDDIKSITKEIRDQEKELEKLVVSLRAKYKDLDINKALIQGGEKAAKQQTPLLQQTIEQTTTKIEKQQLKVAELYKAYDILTKKIDEAVLAMLQFNNATNDGKANTEGLEKNTVDQLKVADYRFTVPAKEMIIEPEEVKLKPLSQELLDKQFDRLVKLKPSYGQDNSALERLRKIGNEAARTAELITSKLTPAIDGFVDALFSGDDPVKAFFEGVKSAIQDVIKELIQAAIRGLIFKSILNGATGGVGGVISGLFGGGGINSIGGSELTLGGNVNFRFENGALVAAMNAGNASIAKNFGTSQL